MKLVNGVFKSQSRRAKGLVAASIQWARDCRAPTCFLILACFFILRATSDAQVPSARQIPQVVRHAMIDQDVPIFVPVHPRIATTITFPRPIGEPVGTGFIDAESAQKSGEKSGHPSRGEYVISYAQGDAFFTVQPLPKSELLNLNVPFEGSTVVLYFYLVDQPLQALASLILNEKNGKHSAEKDPAVVEPGGATDGSISIQTANTSTPEKFRAATPARLEGFLRKLRMIHAAKVGAELTDVAAAMKLGVVVSSAEQSVTTNQIQPVSEGAGFQIILLRAVRDSSLDTVGFIVLLKNTSKTPIDFDLRTLSARCGAALYPARVVDAPAQLKAGEMQPGYFAIVGSGDDRPGYLSPDNDWRLSLARIDPEKLPEKAPHT